MKFFVPMRRCSKGIIVQLDFNCTSTSHTSNLFVNLIYQYHNNNKFPFFTKYTYLSVIEDDNSKQVDWKASYVSEWQEQ